MANVISSVFCVHVHVHTSILMYRQICIAAHSAFWTVILVWWDWMAKCVLIHSFCHYECPLLTAQLEMQVSLFHCFKLKFHLFRETLCADSINKSVYTGRHDVCLVYNVLKSQLSIESNSKIHTFSFFACSHAIANTPHTNTKCPNTPGCRLDVQRIQFDWCSHES